MDAEPLLPMELHVQHDPNPRPPAPVMVPCKGQCGELVDQAAPWGWCDDCLEHADYE